MQVLGLEETTDQLTKVNAVSWHVDVPRKDKDKVLRKVPDFKIRGTERLTKENLATNSENGVKKGWTDRKWCQ